MTASAGVGLYVHITSRKRRHNSKAEPTKGAAAEARGAAADSHCSQPPFQIAQSQLPQGGLFEPVGCPPRLCSTPGSFNQTSFMHSITSSKNSGSMAAGKLPPYPAAMLTANKLATHQHESQHGQQARQQQAARSNSGLIRSTGAQHAQCAAEEALSQEAAAAEEALGSFSRSSSANALYSGYASAQLPARAPIDATAEAKAAAQSGARQLNPAGEQGGFSRKEAPQQVVMQSAAVQHPAGQLEAGAGGQQLTAPEGRQMTRAQVSLSCMTI